MIVFTAYCPDHGCHVLLGFSQLRQLTNLRPGVIALELECHEGHPLLILTGQAVTAKLPTRPAGAEKPPRSTC